MVHYVVNNTTDFKQVPKYTFLIQQTQKHLSNLSVENRVFHSDFERLEISDSTWIGKQVPKFYLFINNNITADLE